MPDWMTLLSWMATYWLHSTLLLGGTWLWFRLRRPASHALCESAWKLAAVGAFLTASLQLGLSIESPLNWAVRTALSKHVEDQAPQVSSLANPGHLKHSEPDDSSELALRESDTSATSVISDELPSSNQFAFDSESQPSRNGIAQDSGDIILLPEQRVASSAVRNAEPAWLIAARHWSKSIMMALGGSLIALSLFGLFKVLAEYFCFVGRMRTCEEITTGSARKSLDRLLTAVKSRRRVTLLIAEDDLEPGAWGLWNWRIVLPPRAIDELPPEELNALLAHELAHLVRGDQWWIWLGHLLTICFGWQPLNRLAFREWRQAAEYLCDAWAVERNVTRLSLARCLTSVAEWRFSSTVPLAGVGGENRSSLSRRVERLIDDTSLNDPWQSRGRRQLLMATGCCIAVLTIWCAPTAVLRAGGSSHETTAALGNEAAIENSLNPDSPASLADKGDPSIVAGDPTVSESNVERENHTQPNPELVAFQKRLDSATVNWDSIPPGRLTRVVLSEVTVELQGLVDELSDLEVRLAESPRFKRSSRIQVQLQHFRARLQLISRTRETLAAQLKL
ncbi:MAG: putative rane protein [Planctomycetaceae bacterium]|nr:putative rane protein [Planctomycetaceae bacterium]